MCVRREQLRAFTLVELLVVIGIIAVLISILLSAVNNARKSATTVQCMSNMRQIGVAMLAYQSENRSGTMPVYVDPGHPYWPTGWFWANELVSRRYLKGPQGTTAFGFMGPSVFRCPAELAEKIDPFIPTYPQPPRNFHSGGINFWNVPSAKEAVVVTYTLNAMNWSRTPSFYNTGPLSTPFMWFQPKSPANPLDNPNHPLAARSMTKIRKASQMVMALESPAINISVPRLSARHGKVTGDGRNAYTNFLFFDGHVGTYPTSPYDRGQQAAAAAGSTNPAQAGFQKTYHKQSDTLFFLTEQ